MKQRPRKSPSRGSISMEALRFIACLSAVASMPVGQVAHGQVEFFEDADDVVEEAAPLAGPLLAPAELKDIEDAFSKGLTEFEAGVEKRRRTLTENYTKALTRLQKKSTDSGDLQTAILILEEINRVAKDLAYRNADSPELADPELRKLHSTFEEAAQAIEKETAPALRRLHEKRVELIHARVMELTKSGNLQAAMDADKFLGSVRRDLPALPLPEGYDLFYPFDESTEGSRMVKDQGPSGFDARNNAPGWVAAGKRGAGYQIHSRTQALLLHPIPALSEDAFTVAAWVNLTKPGRYARLWDRYHDGRKEGYACSFVLGRPVFDYRDKLGNKQHVESSKELTLNRWHHVIFTYDATRCVIYVDGETTANTRTRPIAKGQLHVRIGLETKGGSLPLEGTIDDLIHYPKALSKPEAIALYRAVSGGSPGADTSE